MNSIGTLIHQLGSDDVNDRFQAARGLVKLGPDAAPAIPHLIAALTDQSLPVVDSAMWALGACGESAIDQLATAAQRGESQARQMACHALGRYAPFATAKTAVLTELLGDVDDKVRKAAATSLVSLGQRLGIDYQNSSSPLSSDELKAARRLYTSVDEVRWRS